MRTRVGPDHGRIERVSEFHGVKPQGWPDRVDLPGRPGDPWEQSALKWLFDQVPGAWREGLNGRHLGVEQPARDVDVVHAGIDNDPVGVNA